MGGELESRGGDEGEEEEKEGGGRKAKWKAS